MNEIIEERIKKAQESDGYFITITRREGTTLKHWQKHEGFFPQDVWDSLHEIKMMITKQYPDLNVRKVING